jgi:hypothetical protein
MGAICAGNRAGTPLASSFGGPAPFEATMLRLSDAQRAALTQAFAAVAQLALGALVFGQFLRERPFSFGLAYVGVGIWFWFVGLALAAAGGRR